MKPKRKSPKSVSEMEVLKDLRALFSSGEAKSHPQPVDEEVGKHGDLLEKLRKEIEKLRTEKEELVQRLGSLEAARGKGNKASPSQELVTLKDRKSQLMEAAAEVEEHLQLSTKDLLKKLASAVDSMGSAEMGMELRRAANSLESAEYFAHFLRVLLRE